MIEDIPIEQRLANKENEITAAEVSLGVVEDESDFHSRKITELRNDMDKIRAAIRENELDIQTLAPGIRSGKRNVARMKRELKKLEREYFNRGRT